MGFATSADGTRIAFEATGDGPAIVIVGGAFSTASDAGGLANALADLGIRAVAYDRRARGGSGDTKPYAPEREAEDLGAVIEANGGRAAVLGHSSGAVLALFAASLGLPIDALFLSEPPFRFGEDEPASDLPDRLQAFVDEGRPEEAVATFQLEAVGLPQQVVDQIRASPFFGSLVAVAQSTVYDAALTARLSTPTEAMRRVPVPTLVLCGVETFPFLRTAAARLAETVERAELVEVPESVGHRVDPEATARIIATRLLHR